MSDQSIDDSGFVCFFMVFLHPAACNVVGKIADDGPVCKPHHMDTEPFSQVEADDMINMTRNPTRGDIS